MNKIDVRDATIIGVGYGGLISIRFGAGNTYGPANATTKRHVYTRGGCAFLVKCRGLYFNRGPGVDTK